MKIPVSYCRQAGILVAALSFITFLGGCGSLLKSDLGLVQTACAQDVPQVASPSAALPRAPQVSPPLAGSATYGSLAGHPMKRLPTVQTAANRGQDQAQQAANLASLKKPKKDRGTPAMNASFSLPRKVEHVGTADFANQGLESNVPVLVDFYADWCGPCRRLAPVLDQIARDTPNARVVKVDIDDHPQLAQKYGVRSIPNVMVFKNGEVTAQRTGLADRESLERMLDR
jgi:thioredoxin 1